MSTGSAHHRAKHRSRTRRLALPAVMVCGLTLASLLSNSIEFTFWTTAHAEGPAVVRNRVPPKIVDFSKLAKQKAEARRLLEAARKAAGRGDIDAAQRFADQAAAIPVEWNLGETTPKKFLEGLASEPQQFTETDIRVNSVPPAQEPTRPTHRRRTVTTAAARPISDRDVIELSFPDETPATDAAPEAEEDLSLNGRPTRRPRVESLEAPKSLKTLGFKEEAEEVAPAIVEPQPTTPRRSSRFDPIPSLEELAEATPVPKPAVQPPAQAAEPIDDEPTLPSPKRSVAPTPTAPRPLLTESKPEQPQPDIFNVPIGRIEESDVAESSPKSRTRPQRREPSDDESLASPTTVVHEIRVVDRPAPSESSASTSQLLLMNLNSLLMAGLFGALLLLIVIAAVVLRKFGPNPQFTFKVEVSNPNGLAVAAPVAKAAVPPVAVTPIFALKRQMEEELEQQREDAMMRQVFEENLKLHEQLEETRIAA